jgi:hypothetical protein
MSTFSKPIQRAMAWCGLAFVVIFFAGLLIAGFLPPIPPNDGAAEVARRYQEHTNAIRLGCLLMMIAAAFTIPFTAVVSAQMQRIEGRFTPLCFAQLAAGGIGVLAATLPVLIFSVAAYRPHRDPAMTQAINDLGWFPFIMNFPFATVQCVVIAVAVLSDRNPVPVFPRWVAYFMLWAAVLFAPAGLLTFFKTGPFAWNGLLSFWLAATVFGSWFLVMTWATLRAINCQPDPGAAPGEPLGQAPTVSPGVVLGRP